MDINSVNIDEIVKKVLADMTGRPADAATSSRPAAGGAIPKTAKVAMLTKLENFDIKEYPIPEVGDDDILVKVEGCGVCGTDAHEFKRDPFGMIPVALGHEGTGEIVKMGKNVKKDSAGKDLKVGDKVVVMLDPARKADQIGRNARFYQFFVRHLAVGCVRRVQATASRVGYVRFDGNHL